MGAPKQKWTAEEEAALKAGVVKHGAGKWRTILTDTEFSSILRMRSNVDLKDKWRNINVTAIWGSRQKAKLALKRNQPASQTDNNHTALIAVTQHNEEVPKTKPPAVSGPKLPAPISKEQISRLQNFPFCHLGFIGFARENNFFIWLDTHILEAIINLKDPRGSDRTAIASYIGEQYRFPPNLEKLLSTRLKHMVISGKVIKVQQKYKITPSLSGAEKRCSSSSELERRPKDSLAAEKTGGVNILSKSQIDAEILKAKGMTAQEAAVAAAKAVAEAETAIAEAEAAAKEAEAAEAEAAAAHVFAKAAMKALKCRTFHFCCVP